MIDQFAPANGQLESANDQLQTSYHITASHLRWILPAGKGLTFYIGIQEENWNYAPSGHNLIIGKPIAVDE
uniref:Uncharacterized protein n=1 Tax=Sinocyclocheilus grahami TaxID=75366 RepID=A0A672LPX3_SINGR